MKSVELGVEYSAEEDESQTMGVVEEGVSVQVNVEEFEHFL